MATIVQKFGGTSVGTIERILKVPPLGRSDASATPFWDCFTQKMDATPYDVVERKIPERKNGEDPPGADESKKMDWRGPDRNPKLGVILKNYQHWKAGRISKNTAMLVQRDQGVPIGRCR